MEISKENNTNKITAKEVAWELFKKSGNTGKSDCFHKEIGALGNGIIHSDLF